MRPLYDDGASNPGRATRYYVVESDAPKGEAPLISLFSGEVDDFSYFADELVGDYPAFDGLWLRDRAASRNAIAGDHRYGPQTGGSWVEFRRWALCPRSRLDNGGRKGAGTRRHLVAANEIWSRGRCLGPCVACRLYVAQPVRIIGKNGLDAPIP